MNIKKLFFITVLAFIYVNIINAKDYPLRFFVSNQVTFKYNESYNIYNNYMTGYTMSDKCKERKYLNVGIDIDDDGIIDYVGNTYDNDEIIDVLKNFNVENQLMAVNDNNEYNVKNGDKIILWLYYAYWSWNNIGTKCNKLAFTHDYFLTINVNYGQYEKWNNESMSLQFFDHYNLLSFINKTYPSGYGVNDDIYYSFYYNGKEHTINNLQSFNISNYTSYVCGDNTAYLNIYNKYSVNDGPDDGIEVLDITIEGAIQKAEKPSALSYTICPGEIVNFSSNAINADSYQWEVTNNAESSISGSGSSVNITFKNDFSGDCQVRVRGSGCSEQQDQWSEYRNLYVVPPISENSTMIICKNSICAGCIDTFELFGFDNYDIAGFYVDGNPLYYSNDISLIEELNDVGSKIVVKYNNDNMNDQYVISGKVANHCENSTEVFKTVNMKGLDILNKPNEPISGSGYEVCGNTNVSFKTNEIINAVDMNWQVRGNNNKLVGEVVFNNNKDSCVVNFVDTYKGIAYVKVRAVDECYNPGPWSDSLEIKILPSPGQSNYIWGITSRTKNSNSIDTFKTLNIIYADNYKWNIDTGGTIIDKYIIGNNQAAASVIQWDNDFIGESEITVRGENFTCGFGKYNDPPQRIKTYDYDVNISLLKGVDDYQVVGYDTLLIRKSQPGTYIPLYGCIPSGTYSPIEVSPQGGTLYGDVVNVYNGVPGSCTDFVWYECDGDADTIVYNYMGQSDTIYVFAKYKNGFDSTDIEFVDGESILCSNKTDQHFYKHNIPWFVDGVFYDIEPDIAGDVLAVNTWDDLPLQNDPSGTFPDMDVIHEDSCYSHFSNNVKIVWNNKYKGDVKIRARYYNYEQVVLYNGDYYYSIDTSGWGQWYDINVKNLPSDNIIDTVIGTEFCAGTGNKTKIYLDQSKDFDTILSVGSSPPYGNASWNNDSIVFEYLPFKYGPYKIEIGVRNVCGNIGLKTNSIIIHKLPDVEITSEENSLCEFDSLLLTALPADSGSWNKYFKNDYFMADSGSIGGNLARYEFTDSNGCMNFDTMTIEVIERPGPPAVDSSIFDGNLYTVFAYPYKNFNLSVDSRAGESYNFYNDTLFSLKQDAHALNVFVLNDTGRHKYKIEAEHRGCRSTKKSNVLIKPVYKPGIPGIQVKNKDFEEKGTICLFDTINLTSSLPNNPDVTTYHFKNIFLDDQKQKIALDTLNLGSFNQDSIVLYVATMDSIINQLGVFKNYSDTLKLNIKANIPDLPTLYNPASHYCKWDDVTLFIKDTVNNIHWFTRDDIMFADTNRLVLEKLQGDTTIICRRLNDPGCYSREKVINITLDSVQASFTCDLVEIDPGGRIAFSSTSQNNIKQKWWFGDGSMPNYFADIHHYYYNEGYFDVTLIAESEFGCHDTIVMKDYIKVGNPNNIDDNLSQEIKIYPNPVKNILNIECREGKHLQVLDITGKIILDRLIQTGKTTIDASNWQPGIFIIKIDDKTAKIIKQ